MSGWRAPARTVAAGLAGVAGLVGRHRGPAPERRAIPLKQGTQALPILTGAAERSRQPRSEGMNGGEAPPGAEFDTETS